LAFMTTLISCNRQSRYSLYNPYLGNYLKIKNFNIKSDFNINSEDSDLEFWKDDTGKPFIIDSGGSSLYGSNIYGYGSKKESDYLILWVTENEYISDIRLYILDSDTITKIGNLPIRRICHECDDLVYPIDKLMIYCQKNKIIINPTIAFEYDTGDDKWENFSPGQIYFSIDKDHRQVNITKR
jgi:hypothetical protein